MGSHRHPMAALTSVHRMRLEGTLRTPLPLAGLPAARSGPGSDGSSFECSHKERLLL